MSLKTIVLLEDDPDQIGLFREYLERAFRQAGDRPRLVVLDSESAFRERLEELVNLQPAIFVLDIMVRWKSVGATPKVQKPEHAPPDEAGIRCKDLIRQLDKKVTVAIWTIIEPDTIPAAACEGCQLLNKSDEDTYGLLEWLKGQS